MNNGLLLLVLLAFSAAVFFDLSIRFRNLSSVTFGLIAFPISFVLINIRTLNRRYPLGGRKREEEPKAAIGSSASDRSPLNPG